jgi:hypothetical protein
MMSGLRSDVIWLRRAALTARILAGALLLGGAAAAQAPQQPAQVPQPPTQLQAPGAPQPQGGMPPGTPPGFIDAFGHWIQGSVNDWNSELQGVAKDAADAAGTVTRDTADAVAHFPGARVIAERATCPTAPNGAPDCRVAAETICKRHGFASGSSIDFQTAEKCPPIALNRPDGDAPPPCVLESYVTRALCQ